MPRKDLITGLYELNYENSFYKDYIIKPGQRSQKRNKTRRETRLRTRRRVSRINENSVDNKENKEEIKQNNNENDNVIENKNEKNYDNDLKRLTINEGLETAETNQNDNIKEK